MGDLGLTYEGLTFALDIKDRYKREEPLLTPGATSSDSILIPEHLLNPEVSLSGYDDPIALAVIATKDPESPMALSAAARLGPRARDSELVGGIISVIGEATKHEMVGDCCKLLTSEAFSPESLAEIRHRASHHVFQTREEYRNAMTGNLRRLLDGDLLPRPFLKEFIDLARYGNLRLDIYKRLIVKLMRSEAVRPSLKFMILERLDVFPKVVQLQIVTAVNAGPVSPEFETLRRELRWIYELKTAGTGEGPEALMGEAAKAVEALPPSARVWVQ